MPRSAGIMAFPEFRGFTRKLILWNLGIFFSLLVLGLFARGAVGAIVGYLALTPVLVAHGYVWQLVTYCFIHTGILNTALELLSLWFLGSFLEDIHGPRWMGELFFVSVIGAGVAAVALSFALAPSIGLVGVGLTGCFGGIFGLLIAFGVLHGDMSFMMFPLPIQIKAKYLVTVYLLIAFASFFLSDKIYALAQLGGALCGSSTLKPLPAGAFFPEPANAISASGTAITSGSAAAPHASLRSTCASKTARFTSIAKAATSIPIKAKIPTTSAG